VGFSVEREHGVRLYSLNKIFRGCALNWLPQIFKCYRPRGFTGNSFVHWMYRSFFGRFASGHRD